MRATGIGSKLARLWQRLAPEFVITRTFYGVKVCVDFRDHAIWWASDSRRVEQAEGFDKMLSGVKGRVWDVGCNVGIFSLYAAAQGNEVTAFDISPKAARLVTKSAALNQLPVRMIARAFAVRAFDYTPPASADTQNRAQEGIAAGVKERSITFKEVAKQFGTPDFIKLDIEHGEVEFLKSQEFRTWISEHKIPLLMEIHELSYWDLVWQDVPYLRLDHTHALFNPLPEMKTAFGFA